jgi:hypothetical protein
VRAFLAPCPIPSPAAEFEDEDENEITLSDLNIVLEKEPEESVVIDQRAPLDQPHG